MDVPKSLQNTMYGLNLPVWMLYLCLSITISKHKSAELETKSNVSELADKSDQTRNYFDKNTE